LPGSKERQTHSVSSDSRRPPLDFSRDPNKYQFQATTKDNKILSSIEAFAELFTKNSNQLNAMLEDPKSSGKERNLAAGEKFN